MNGTVMSVCLCVCASEAHTCSNASYIILCFCRRDRNTVCKCLCLFTVPALSLRGRGCAYLFQESRWTVHPLCCCHLCYFQECDTSVPQGMGTKEESFHPPWTSHYFEWLASASSTAHSSLEILLPRGHLEKERGGAAANLTQAGPRGRSQSVVATSAAPACCLTVGQ